MSDRTEQYKSILFAAAPILLNARNAIAAAYENAHTPHRIADAVFEVPIQLRQAATLIESILILNRVK